MPQPLIWQDLNLRVISFSKMRRFFSSLLVLSALTSPVFAQDDVADVLGLTPDVAPASTAPVRVAPNPSAPPPIGMLVSDPAPVVKKAAAVPVAVPLHKTSMKDVLAKAYVTSPYLRAEREVLRQQYENVAQADSNKRPYITAQGGAAVTHSDLVPGGKDDYLASDASINLTQYLYRGGRTLAEVDRQLSLSSAAMAAYNALTQNAFLNVIIAAMDIQTARVTIDLTEKSREAIQRQMERSQRAFDVGELTRTDVAQSQARLAGAEADLTAAKADLADALARFRQYAGQDGNDLVIDMTTPDLPASLDAAQARGEADHPVLIAAREDEKAAAKAIDVARGALLPELYVSGTAGKSWDPSPLVDESTNAALGLRASMPLYEGGAVRSLVRQAKYSQFEKQDRVEDAQRDVRRAITTAWSDYEASKSAIAAREKQVEAAELARNGVYRERDVGTRTVLDTLNADAELLDAQVSLVRAERDETVAGYGLLAATGGFTAEKLGFFDAGAEKKHLGAARSNWFGTGAKPRE